MTNAQYQYRELQQRMIDNNLRQITRSLDNASNALYEIRQATNMTPDQSHELDQMLRQFNMRLSETLSELTPNPLNEN